jgi:hypothetical protein
MLLTVFLRSLLWLLVNSNVVPSSPISVTLMMEAIRFSETSFITTAIQRKIPEYGILQGQCFVHKKFVAVQLLVITKIVPSSPIPVTLTMEARRSSETSVATRATRRNIAKDVILHSLRRDSIKSYTVISC